MTPTQVDWVRLAAFIDGEGMIDIHTHRQFRKHLARVHETRYVRIIIVNTDPRLARWCQATFGGSVSFGRRKNPKHRPTLGWYVSSRKAIEILKGCMPYLLLKLEQAEVGLVFQATVKRIGRNGHSEETLKRRVELQEEMKRLKRVARAELPGL